MKVTKILLTFWRILLASILTLSFIQVNPVYANDIVDLYIIHFDHNGGDFVPLETGRTYTIRVHNLGDVDSSGEVTVTDTLPDGLTATGISGTGWNCTLATLTCTRSDVLPTGEAYPDITLTVSVDVDAPPSVINTATVSGGNDGELANNTETTTTPIDAKPDLIITGYELVDTNGDPLLTDLGPNEEFGIRVLVKNQGGEGTDGVFYRSVYINRNPMDTSLFILDEPGEEGCLYNIAEEENDWGDFQKQNFISGLPAGVTDTETIVTITGGLPSGSYQIYLYADPTCIVDNESTENNNSYGPIPLSIGGSGDINVTIGGNLMGTYPMASGESAVQKYPVTGGPVVLSSNGGVDFIASLNQWRRLSASAPWTGVAQSMAIPIDLITDTYVMPRYVGNDPLLYNAILMANVDTVSRDITVTIEGNVMGTYTLGPSESRFEVYNNVVGGPIVVSSDTGAQIVASLYELKRGSAGGYNGQSEMNGLPFSQLTDTYLIPIYFGNPVHVGLDARIFIANADAVSRDITVTIGGNLMGTYTLGPNTSQSLKYPVTGGPVEISGPPGSQIIASLNQWRRLGAGSPFTGVAQSMAIPSNLITNQYVMPRYVGNDPLLYNAVLMANVDTVSRDITVTIAGNVMGTYTLGPSESQFVVYNGVVGGPIVVSGDTGAQIVASLYELKRGAANSGYNGQSEMNGLPFSQLSDTYLIPIYFGNPVHVGLDAKIFIAVP